MRYQRLKNLVLLMTAAGVLRDGVFWTKAETENPVRETPDYFPALSSASRRSASTRWPTESTTSYPALAQPACRSTSNSPAPTRLGNLKNEECPVDIPLDLILWVFGSRFHCVLFPMDFLTSEISAGGQSRTLDVADHVSVRVVFREDTLFQFVQLVQIRFRVHPGLAPVNRVYRAQAFM